ncbi:MAG: energy-coupling factor ABC transporter ATP-binding protein [Candidatus Aquicultor secundus]|uniref:ABC transporter ATP-binding protein n=1 Tax=Candidatus Aquicultor secundus TaxID=1973895 RepID=A0A2M7T515_9ACTN|nr:ATP-binding cassette domain-containing protein [Candidatus Aquicultor secundus]NCO65733.1 ATP-binding cassette domain-containing protein [Solirubrobacter sp.]OIO88485.1 MAG: energy-coupling factor ABC transporter ATP-binding protein [Candidatus Aquicultor secundus]PIU26262.1 MAG: energy-coupling factor ABC transporter ATP-binding protein [Candidatus Aquicultor secundus]PIW22286.1 MAG: energy-coupling factor ABC transporter ATP-binding protein [Candidatus Aquicultor secundus]PIX51861.1 MAG: 
MSIEPIIETRGLGFSYVDGTQALVDVTISIPKGKRIAFLGPNGSGKTTLFLHFNGLMRPDRGKIFFDGREVSYKHHRLLELRKQVGIIFQDPETQLFSSSVKQEISFGPINLGLSRNDVEERVKKAMDDTGIADLKNKPTHFLSYGQKKRVAIADILAMEPRVLVCDEPTAWLDKKHEGQIMRLLDEINSDGITVIMSTHDVDIAYSWADYIFVMNKGSVIGEGTPEQIFYDLKLLEEAELERPWLLDIYDDLSNKGFLNRDNPPKTKDELLLNLANCVRGT